MSVSSAALRQQGSSSGFTLVELLVTIAVVGIVTVVAVPSVQNLINANRLAASAEDLSAALQLARSEANRRNTVVTICATSNGTTCANTRAWNRWIILGRDTTAALSTVDVIRDASVPARLSISGPATGIRFRPSGLIDAQQIVTVCIPGTSLPQNQRQLTVQVSGLVRATPISGGGTCP